MEGTDGLPSSKLEIDIAVEPMGYHPIAKMMQEAVAARKKVEVKTYLIDWLIPAQGLAT